jgi:hypothetical protein
VGHSFSRVATSKQHGSVNMADDMVSTFFRVFRKLFNAAREGKPMAIVHSLSICTFLVLSVTIVCAINPDRDIHQLAHRSWGERDGYPGQCRMPWRKPQMDSYG